MALMKRRPEASTAATPVEIASRFSQQHSSPRADRPHDHAARIGIYGAALVIPLAMTYAVSAAQLPAFVFEHAIVLLVVGVAIRGGVGPAIVTAFVSVIADNVLLREPVGRPTITGTRDIIDLFLFAAVAIIVSTLMRRAHQARRAAEEAAERERRAREDRNRLIETITHDLATPLSVLSASVQFAKRTATTSEFDWSRLLDRLDTATARATSLLRLLADVDMLDSDELTLDLAEYDLRELVMPIVIMMDRCSERHPVILAAPDRPLIVHGDAGRLQRVLENLIGNAIKYSPQGGAVEVTLSAAEGSAVLRVRDHGIGISPAAMPRIFERSYRATQAAASAPGLGLGLSIAAHVVSRHRGSITALPAEGEGTVVEVRLPLCRPHADSAGALREPVPTASAVP